MCIRSRPDTILLSPAFGLESTRSPRAVDARAEYAGLQSKRAAGVMLTQQEKKQEKQLAFFVQPEPED